MYPQTELNHLAARKLTLRRDISLKRETCAAASARATKPLVWLDRAVALYQRASPFIPLLSTPLMLFVTRKRTAKPSLIQSAIKWAPLVFQAARFFRTSGPAAPASRKAKVGRVIPSTPVGR